MPIRSTIQEKERMQMSIYAVAKKNSYVVSAEESKAMFSTDRNPDSRKKVTASACKLKSTCLRKGAVIAKKSPAREL